MWFIPTQYSLLCCRFKSLNINMYMLTKRNVQSVTQMKDIHNGIGNSNVFLPLHQIPALFTFQKLGMCLEWKYEDSGKRMWTMCRCLHTCCTGGCLINKMYERTTQHGDQVIRRMPHGCWDRHPTVSRRIVKITLHVT